MKTLDELIREGRPTPSVTSGGRWEVRLTPVPSMQASSQLQACVVFRFELTPAQNAAAVSLILSVGLKKGSGLIEVSERLGGYVVEPGGTVCPDWPRVLVAIRKLRESPPSGEWRDRPDGRG